MSESDPSQQRKLTTVLAADVASYSRLMADDEERTLSHFIECKQIFESLVASHDGRIFNTAGDSILAEFNSAVEAVRCATEIQPALHTRNDKLPPDQQIRFRIGVNVGDVVVQGSDLLGDGVNVAARLEQAAAPGGICISGSLRPVQEKLALSFNAVGPSCLQEYSTWNSNLLDHKRCWATRTARTHGAISCRQAADKSGGDISNSKRHRRSRCFSLSNVRSRCSSCRCAPERTACGNIRHRLSRFG